jgi:acetyl-CoA C-acetyltransferase
MGMRVQPGVIGCMIRPAIAARDRSLEELIYDTAQLALADAGITIDDIDGIVVAANDQFDGRSISVMMASGSVGGVDRDIMSTPSASEHAFILGALRVATGQFRTQLVVLDFRPRASKRGAAAGGGSDFIVHCHSMSCRRMCCRRRPSRAPAPVPQQSRGGRRIAADAWPGRTPLRPPVLRWPVTLA